VNYDWRFSISQYIEPEVTFEQYDEQLQELKSLLGEVDYAWCIKAFKKFNAREDSTNQNKWYINQQSLSEKFEEVFGISNDFFWKVFFYYLTNGTEMKRIPLYNFIKQMSPFLSDDIRTMMNWAFKFYDINHSGSISIINLLQAQATVSCDTQYGEEIHMIVKKYVDEVLLGKQRRRTIFNIVPHNFNVFLTKSCIISEILSKVFERSTDSWPKIEADSIFSLRGKYTHEDIAKKMSKSKKMYKNLNLESFDYNKLKI